MSENSKSVSTGSGIGICTVLGIIFIVLKLTGQVTWSWIWVLSPFWIGFAFWIVVILLIALFVGLGIFTARRR